MTNFNLGLTPEELDELKKLDLSGYGLPPASSPIEPAPPPPAPDPMAEFAPEREADVYKRADEAGQLGLKGGIGAVLASMGSAVSGQGSPLPLIDAERERRRKAIIDPYLQRKADTMAAAKEQRAKDFETELLGKKQAFETGESEKDRTLRIYLAEIAAGADAQTAAQRASEKAQDRSQRAAEAEDKRAESERGRSERSQDIRIQGFANKVRDAALPESLAALENIENLIAEADKESPGDLPGYGVAAGMLPSAVSLEKGQQLRQAIQQLANMRLKARSGAAVTDSEYARFLDELRGGTAFVREDRIRQGLKQIRKELEATAKNLKGSISKEALEEYHARTGDPMLQRVFGGAETPAAAPKAQRTPEEIDAEMAAIRKQLGR